MEEKQKLFEDLEYIKQIIQDSRNVVVQNGIGFIVWGIIIILGLVFSYIDTSLSGDQYSAEGWLILISGGWLYTIFSWLTHRKVKKTITFAQRIIGSTWLATGITMTLLGFVGPATDAYNGVYVSPLLASILGIAFFITANIHNSKILKFIAPLWWLGAAYMFIFPGIQTIIVMAAMMLFLQVIPGIVFYRKYKAESNNGI
jgi:hypothetical protein